MFYKMRVPKLIMQTWKTREIPKQWEESPESIKRILPDWKYVLMTDEDNRNFVKTHFPDFLPYYDAFPYNIQRADAIRPCWLYVYGGVYMDLDFVIRKNLNNLFNSKDELYFVNSGNVSSVITNSFMASIPKNPFWLYYIEEIKKSFNNPSWWAFGKHLKIMDSTGPLCLTRALKNYSKMEVKIFENKIISPCSVCNISCDVKDSYLRPLNGGSWHSFDSKFFNFILCHWIKIIFTIIIIIAILKVFK